MEDRICPNCDEEFQATIEICLDCGTATVPRSAAPIREEGPVTRQGLEPGEEAFSLRTADYDWASHLVEKLDTAGLRSTLIGDKSCCPPRFTVFVPASDLERAGQIDRELYLERVPDAAGDLPADGDDETCPACGSKVAPKAAECGECGLGLGPPAGLSCPACGSQIDSGATECSDCGLGLEAAAG